MTRGTVTFIRTGTGFALVSRYDTDLIAAAKDVGGRWDPKARHWTFTTEQQVRALTMRLKGLGFTVVSDVDEAASSHPGDTKEVSRLRAKVADLEAEVRTLRRMSRMASSSDDRVLRDLLSTFGLPGYRALTKVAHPDREGGSHDWMVRINAAWERVGKGQAS
jgi:hypothetical protein